MSTTKVAGVNVSTDHFIDGKRVGWPRDILLQWADASERKRMADVPHVGYAPFERNLWRKSS